MLQLNWAALRSLGCDIRCLGCLGQVPEIGQVCGIGMPWGRLGRSIFFFGQVRHNWHTWHVWVTWRESWPSCAKSRVIFLMIGYLGVSLWKSRHLFDPSASSKCSLP